MEKLEDFVEKPYIKFIKTIESISNLEESNFEEIFNLITEDEQHKHFYISCINYMIEIRPKRRNILNELVKKVSIKFGLEYKYKLGSLVRSGSLEEIIFNDDVEGLIKICADPSFNPKDSSYAQLMALFGSIKCFKYALLDGSFSITGIESFAIAGGNIEIIRLLEQNGYKFQNTLDTAIIFHRYSITDWIINNYKACLISPLDAATKYNLRAFFYAINKNIFVSLQDIVLCNEFFIKHQAYDMSKFIIRLVKGNEKYDTIRGDIMKDSLFSVLDNKNIDFLKSVVEEFDADINMKSSRTRDRVTSKGTLLHFAIFQRDTELFNYLITKDVSLHHSFKTKGFKHPTLNLATLYGTKEMIEMIYSKQSANSSIMKYMNDSCSAYGEKKISLIRVAIERNDLDIIKFIVEKCHADVTDPDIIYCQGRPHIVEYFNERKLINIYAENGDTEAIKTAYEKNPGIFMSFFNGETPLLIAAKKGHISVMRFLLQNCLELCNYCDVNLDSPFSVGVNNNNLSVIKCIMEYNPCAADYVDKRENSVIYAAIKTGNLELIKFFAENYPNYVCQNDQKKITPIGYSIHKNQFEILKYFIEEIKFNVNEDDINEALISGNISILEYFIEKKYIDINKVDQKVFLGIGKKEKFYALRYLFEKYRIDCTNIKDETGFTVISYAINAGDIDFIKYFNENNKIDWRVTDNHKRTYLHLAIIKSDIEIVKFIGRLNKVNVNALDKNGRTALCYACEKGEVKIAKFLFRKCGGKLFDKDRVILRLANECNNKELIDFLKYEVKVSSKQQNYDYGFRRWNSFSEEEKENSEAEGEELFCQNSDFKPLYKTQKSNW